MPVSKSISQLHVETTVVDSHHDILMHVFAKHKKGDIGILSRDWAPRLKAGGVDVQVLPIYVENQFLPALGLHEALHILMAAVSDIAQDNSGIELAATCGEIKDIVARDKVAGILALEGCDGLRDPAILRAMYRLGVRMVGFTWERRNEFADGTGETNPGGLTAIGRTALKEMATHNVLFDVSHLAEPGFWEAIDIIDGPLIASHSNARAVLDHPRNLTNDQIKALAAKGGVIGMNFVGFYVHSDWQNVTLNHMIDHVAHIADLVGIEHVGIGADLLESPLRELAITAIEQTNIDPALIECAWIPDGQKVEDMPNFTAALAERGFSEDDTKAVLGGNFMRIFEQVWQ